MSSCASVVSSGENTATPTVAPTATVAPELSVTGSPMASTTRASTGRQSSPSTQVSTSTNSSPPRRAAVSSGRMWASSRLATVSSNWSPASCPCSSLTALKPSRSR